MLQYVDLLLTGNSTSNPASRDVPSPFHSLRQRPLASSTRFTYEKNILTSLKRQISIVYVLYTEY